MECRRDERKFSLLRFNWIFFTFRCSLFFISIVRNDDDSYSRQQSYISLCFMIHSKNVYRQHLSRIKDSNYNIREGFGMKLRYILNNISILGTKETCLTTSRSLMWENVSLGGELSESWLRKTHSMDRHNALPSQIPKIFFGGRRRISAEALPHSTQAVAVRRNKKKKQIFHSRSLHTQFSLTRWDVPKIQPIFYSSTQHFLCTHISELKSSREVMKIYNFVLAWQQRRKIIDEFQWQLSMKDDTLWNNGVCL